MGNCQNFKNLEDPLKPSSKFIFKTSLLIKKINQNFIYFYY